MIRNCLSEVSSPRLCTRRKQLRKRRSGVHTSWRLLALGTVVPALGVVSPAMSAMTVAAETTIDQTNRKPRSRSSIFGDVASLFMENHANTVRVLSRRSNPITLSLEVKSSTNQLSSLSAPNKSNAIPHVDIAAWSPYSNRLRKQASGLRNHAGRDACMHLVEFLGAVSFSEWEASWDVFVVATIMSDVASPKTLRRFGTHVRNCDRACGACCCSLLHQAAVRMRSGEFERSRRRGGRMWERQGWSNVGR